MSDPLFFSRAGDPTLADVIAWTGAVAPEGADLTRAVLGVAPLDRAGPGDIAFLDNAKYAQQLTRTRALACLLGRNFAEKTPPGTLPLVCADPYRAMAEVAGRLYPEARRPGSQFGAAGVSSGCDVHPQARLEHGVSVDPGAVIGPHAVIGSGTIIGAGAVIGPGVHVGRDCSIGPHVSLQNALIGDRVIVHAGVRVGQDGFGFAMGPRGHLKVPQIGRVIIQDDVEIGANTTIDRGANRDTVIGEGTKIDNLVQIGHNVSIGRHCVIVAQVGIAGSCEIGDFVAIGGQAGLAGHLKIGSGAQISGKAGVVTDIPAGERWGGIPAAPMRDALRRIFEVDRLVAKANARTPTAGKDA